MSQKIIEVQVWPVRNNTSKLKAMATVTLAGIKISGVRVIEGKAREGSNEPNLFAAMPSEKKPGTEKYFDFVRITDENLRNEIQQAVVDTYKQTVAQG